MVTKALVALYEAADKPQDPQAFVVQYLSSEKADKVGDLSEQITRLTEENNKLRAQLAALEGGAGQA
jgi:hypothetical protein